MKETGSFTGGALLRLRRARAKPAAIDPKKGILVLVVLSWLITLALAAPHESQAQLKVLPLANPLESLAQSSKTLPFIDTYKAPSTSDNGTQTYEKLLSSAKEKGSVRIIVGLKASFKPEGELNSRKAVRRQRSKTAQLQRSVLSKLSSRKATSVKAVKRFKFIPAMAMEVNARALEELNSLREVAGVSEDKVVYPTLAESIPLVGADEAWSMGYGGQGQTVAIIDTGVDKEHLFLEGKVVAEACYAANGCPQDNRQGVYVGAGVPCAYSGCDHGTHVAGIAAGNGEDLDGVSFSGVAKDANLIAVQVFFWVDGSGVVSSTSYIISGLESVYALKDSYNIAAVNMSLGMGLYSDPCDKTSENVSTKQAIDNLRLADIATVAASGNNASAKEIISPACISSAVSVGNTTKQDNIYQDPLKGSNSAYFLDLLAPGTSIKSSVTGNSFSYKTGTSMAAPHVAGAWAVLKSKRPDAGVAEILSALKYTGAPVTDPRNGLTRPRIQVDAAVQQLNNNAIDLLSDANVQIDGSSAGDQAGRSVAEAGDVNGDGIDDVIVGAPYADNNDRIDSGSAYVVYGKDSTGTVDLNDLGEQGFRIDGAAASDYAGRSVAGVGDVNGDGRDDVIVGAYGAGNNDLDYSGSAYVVYGSASPANIDLNDFGSEQGFRIDGAAASDYAGNSVSSAGDVNGDGKDDVIVGAYSADNNGSYSGSAYVIYGTNSSSTVNLADIGAQDNQDGFRIDGAAASDYAGSSVAGAGDVNGDERDDVIVGAYGTDNNGSGSGSAYVIYGKADDPSTEDVREDTATVDLADLGDRGFRIDGAAASDYAGSSVAGAGDVNDDGRPDVIVGAYGTDNNGRDFSGSAYVIYGRESTETIDLNELGEGGFRIDGAASDDRAGTSVTGAGDVNKDSYPDVIVGATGAGSNGREDSGSAYVIFGSRSNETVNLAQLDEQGFSIDGANGGDDAGSSVAGAGDVNGDGKDDLIVGAPNADNNGREDSGSAYIVNGCGSLEVAYDRASLVTTVGTSIEPPLEPSIDGADLDEVSFWITSELPAGLVFDTDTGVISGTPAEPSAITTYTVTMTHPAGCVATAELTIRVKSPPAPDGRIDLRTNADIQIDGAADGDKMGWSVSGAGDVNGDGDPDVIVGAPADSSICGDWPPRSAYVIFGGEGMPETIDLYDDLGEQGFRIDGIVAGWGCANAYVTGNLVSGAGDVNGDGKDDVIVGAPGDTGSAYVVFGKSDSTDVDLADFGSSGNAEGFRIDGAASGDYAGLSVSGAGDVNGDGRDDVIVGAPLAGNNDRLFSGSAYVVYGKASTDTVELAGIGMPDNTDGFRIDGAAGSPDPDISGDNAGNSVSGAGDVNGDGKDDVIVGAPYAGNNNRYRSGSAYVIFGKSGNTDTIDLAEIDTDGFMIGGATGCDPSNPGCSGDLAGWSVSGAGDVNGDEFDDVIVGAFIAGNNGTLSGSAYVIYGTSSNATIDLDALGEGGFRIDGDELFFAGYSVSGAGDVNGDGRDDVIVGAPYASNNSRDFSGSAYVVYGKSSTETVDLAQLNEQGLSIDGGAPSDVAGTSVSGIGDVGNDGFDDVIVGAPNAGNSGRDFSGSAYIINGCRSPVVFYDPDSIEALEGNQIEPLRPTITCIDPENVSFTVTPDLPEDLTLNPDTGVISGTPTKRQSAVTYKITATLQPDDQKATANVTIEVKPGLAYEPNSIVAVKDKAITELEPVINADLDPEDVSFEIAPDLPAGLSLSSSSGVISGAPTNAQPEDTYTVTMDQLSEPYYTASADVTIEVVDCDELQFQYNNDSKIEAVAEVLIDPPLTPTVEGPYSSDVSFALAPDSPDLPVGLSLSSSSGVISGAPTNAQLADTYTIAVTSTKYDCTATTDVTVEVDMALTYEPDSLVAVKDKEIVPITPTVDGAEIEDVSFALALTSRALPAGLNLNYDTGEIWGAPTEAKGPTTYDITVSHDDLVGLMATNQVKIEVIDCNDLQISYGADPIAATAGEEINLEPTVGDADISSVSFALATGSPSLPAGLSLSSSSGVISGTPTNAQLADTYTVTMTYNSVCEASTDITIEVGLGFNYDQSSIVAVAGLEITPITAEVVGAGTNEVIFTVDDLPEGLSLNEGTGEISGIPSRSQPQTPYTITATMAQQPEDITATAEVTIEISLGLLTYEPDSLVAVKDKAIEPLVPTVYGADPSEMNLSFEVSPALPAGLKLDPDDGIISGTPVVVKDATAYAVTVTQLSDDQTATTDVMIEVKPGLAYEPSLIAAVAGEEIETLVPDIYGVEIDQVDFTVSPALPEGLELDTDNGEISGTPTVVKPAATYTVTMGQQSGAYYSATARIAVRVDPSFIYEPDSLIASRGEPIKPLTPTVTGASPFDDLIFTAPSLPAGLSIDPITGVISGAPLGVQRKTGYAITVTSLLGDFAKTTRVTIQVKVSRPNTIDLSVGTDLRIDGASEGDYAGYSVSDAGDVNGDGRPDVIVGAYYADNNGSSSGSAYVIYGRESNATIDLNELDAEDGFRIDGAAASDNAGQSVAAAGDVNGDGKDDVIVGAPYAGNNGYGSGSAYVIYGKDSNTTIDLADIEAQDNEDGFRIDGAASYDYAGRSVSGAGDVNGDGRDDVIVGAYGADNNGSSSGSAYVVYGRYSADTIDLDELDAEDGFRIDGAASSDYAGYSVAGAGDVNGDGRPDVIVGAYYADNNDRYNSGSAYVIYGSASPASIDLNEFDAEDGFRIDGAASYDYAGSSVSGAGDVNGDGKEDVIVGAYKADNNGRLESGSAYVIYGSASPATIDLNDLGSGSGFRIDGAASYDYAGYSVSSAGDVNGDGRDDVIVGAYGADNNRRSGSGSAHVIYGTDSNATIDLNEFGESGFRIDGAARGDYAGYSVAGAGDVNGDGRPDVIVGAYYADNNDRYNSGSAYVTYSLEPEIVTVAEEECVEYGNAFRIFDLGIDTPDSLDEYAVSSVTGEFLACGGTITDQPPPLASDEYEAAATSLNKRIYIQTPPEVQVNSTSNLVDGSYVGSMTVNLLSWDGSIDNPVSVPDVELVLKVDETSEGRDCPEDAVACYKATGSSSGDTALSGHGWLWVTERAGNYTLTIGEFYNDTNEGIPTGITKVSDFLLCGYAGSPDGEECGDGSDTGKWLQKNGRSPDWYGKTGCPDDADNGVYSVTSTNRAGRVAAPAARYTVPWTIVNTRPTYLDPKLNLVCARVAPY